MENINKKEKKILFDTYTAVIIVIFIGNSILNFFFLEDKIYTIVFIVLSILMILTLFIPNSIRYSKNLLIFIFFFIGLLIFYFDLVAGKGAVDYLSYISLTTAIAFFFNLKKDKFIMLALVGTYITFFLISNLSDYSILPNLNQNNSYIKQRYIRICKIFEIVFCTLVAIYFIYRKEKVTMKYYLEIKNLNTVIKSNKKILSKELYDMAVNNNPLFIDTFNTHFPNFFNDILEINSNIIISELEICALIKLGLKTKEIAQVTKSTVRAVENKKFRIRKKLNIPNEMDTHLFIINTFN